MATENPQKNAHERSKNRYQRPKDILKAAAYLFPEEKAFRNTASFVLEQRKKQQGRSESARKREFEKKETEKIQIENKENDEKGSGENRESYSKVTSGVFQNSSTKSFETVQKIFKNAKMPFDKDIYDSFAATNLSIDGLPSKPRFPIIIFTLAVIKDILDVPLDISVAGVIAATIFSFLIGIVIFFWGFGKTKRWQSKLFKGFVKRWGIMFVIEIIPGLQVIPATAIFVFLTHFRETKFVNTILKIV